jgi:hypothetical protein
MPQIQVAYLFRCPGMEMTHHEARNLVARLADGDPSIPSALFHYEGGQPIAGLRNPLYEEGYRIEEMDHLANAMPRVRFRGGRDRLVITALGKDMADQLDDCAGRLLRGLGRETGTAAVFERREGPIDVRVGERLVTYRIPTLIGHPKHFSKLADASTPAEQTAFAEALIRRDIERQCTALLLDLPDDFSLAVKSIGAFFPWRYVALSEDKNKLAPAFRYVMVETNLELTGDWAVGSLTARGQGSLVREYAQRRTVRVTRRDSDTLVVEPVDGEPA